MDLCQNQYLAWRTGSVGMLQRLRVPLVRDRPTVPGERKDNLKQSKAHSVKRHRKLGNGGEPNMAGPGWKFLDSHLVSQSQSLHD